MVDAFAVCLFQDPGGDVFFAIIDDHIRAGGFGVIRLLRRTYRGDHLGAAPRRPLNCVVPDRPGTAGDQDGFTVDRPITEDTEMCRHTGNTESCSFAEGKRCGQGTHALRVERDIFGSCAVLAAFSLAVVEPDPIAHRVAGDTVAKCFDDAGTVALRDDKRLDILSASKAAPHTFI